MIMKHRGMITDNFTQNMYDRVFPSSMESLEWKVSWTPAAVNFYKMSSKYIAEEIMSHRENASCDKYSLSCVWNDITFFFVCEWNDTWSSIQAIFSQCSSWVLIRLASIIRSILLLTRKSKHDDWSTVSHTSLMMTPERSSFIPSTTKVDKSWQI